MDPLIRRTTSLATQDPFKDSGFISHGRSIHFYRLSHSELDDIEKVNGLEVPTRQILDSKGEIPSKIAADAKVAIQEMGPTTPNIAHSKKKVKPSKKLNTLNLVDLSNEGDIEQQLQDSTRGTMQTLRIKNEEIRASTDAVIRNQGALIKTLEIQIGQISKELATMKYPKGIAENMLVGIGKFVFPIDFIILDMPEDVKVPLILERPFLSTAYAKIDVFKRKITLRVVEEFRARNDARMVSKNFGYPSDCNRDKKIHFAVLEDMDAYRDDGMGDDLAAKKSTMLGKYLQSGNLEVLES
ncbi:putative reverse transcriptase domain-containing protein [Tanacetum coccineum]